MNNRLIDQYHRKHPPGQGMTEFALILPVLMLVVTGVIAMGHLFFSYIMTVSASREGTRYGSVVGVNEEGIVQYRDCDNIRAAARRVGWFANITDEDITITYDSGPGTNTLGNCPIGGLGPVMTSGNRINVRIEINYVPLVPFIRFPNIPMEAESARTILREVVIGTAPAVPPPPDPVAIPDLEMYPQEHLVEVCEPLIFTEVGTLTNIANGAHNVAINVQLHHDILEGGQYINSINLNPNFWPEIGAGESVNYNITVALHASWTEALPGTIARFNIFATSENHPDDPNSLIVTIVNTCEPEDPGPTNTPSPTYTPWPTATPTLTPTVTPTPTATNSPTPTATPIYCPAAGELVFGDSTVLMSLTNEEAYPMRINRIEVTWPVTSPRARIQLLSFGTATLWTANIGLNPPVQSFCETGCSATWSSPYPQDRTLTSGEAKVLTAGYSRNIPNGYYSIRTVYDNGCALTVSSIKLP
jgi:hypothetical protein